MRTNSEQVTGLLVEVQRRRAELRASMGMLERALASAPAVAALTWEERLRAALVELYEEFGEHVAITEGADGLYQELVQRSPRLARAIERLTQEHQEITRRLEEMLTLADVTDDLADVPQVRRKGTDLLAVLMRHRQHGADLLFEAYDLDIGGET